MKGVHDPVRRVGCSRRKDSSSPVLGGSGRHRWCGPDRGEGDAGDAGDTGDAEDSGPEGLCVHVGDIR